MATGNRKTSGRNTTKTKKERMAEMEKAEAFRTEIILWIIVAVALLLFISMFSLVSSPWYSGTIFFNSSRASFLDS